MLGVESYVALKKGVTVSKHKQNPWGTTDTSLQFVFADTHAQV